MVEKEIELQETLRQMMQCFYKAAEICDEEGWQVKWDGKRRKYKFGEVECWLIDPNSYLENKQTKVLKENLKRIRW